MASLAPRDRLRPSLLDLLTDTDPGTRSERVDAWLQTLTELRESVLRDLGWLLNTIQLEANVDLEPYPRVRESVVNYGVRTLSGVTLTNADVFEIERAIRRSIISFEPRLLPGELTVRVAVDEQRADHQALTVKISGQLWADPFPFDIYLKTLLNLDSGDVQVEVDQ